VTAKKTLACDRVCLQQIRLVIDRCDSATVTETDEASIEDRRPCEAVGETPGDAEQVNVILPLQLGGRMRPSARYPPHVIREGFRGCLRNFVHNEQVRSALQWFIERLFLAQNYVQLTCSDIAVFIRISHAK